MAKTPDSTPTSTPASRRRTLFAAAGAVIMGGGITAGAAASVADFAEADVRLIALCNRYVEADIRHLELCGRQDAMADAHESAESLAEWRRLDDLVLQQGNIMLGVEGEIVALRATSPAGVEAKARVVSRISRFIKQGSGGDLVRSLLADLLPAGRA